MARRTDPYTDNSSSLPGWTGRLESALKKIRYLSQGGLFLVTVGICLTVLGTAASVGFRWWHWWSPQTPWAQGLTFVTAYYLSGLSLLVIAPAMNFILGIRYWLRAGKGNVYSLSSIPWFIHNALIYIVRYTFLPLVTPSPLNVMFYRLMGMKIGKGVTINTTNISDAGLIELGNYVTIGGSAHLLTHYAQGGYLVVSTIKIGHRSTIGLKATVFGNVEIGQKCLVGPHQVVLPKTRLADGEQLK